MYYTRNVTFPFPYFYVGFLKRTFIEKYRIVPVRIFTVIYAYRILLTMHGTMFDNLMNAPLKKEKTAKIAKIVNVSQINFFKEITFWKSYKWWDKKTSFLFSSLEYIWFDCPYMDFSFDPYNVRLGLATNRFNPCGNMSTSHSTKLVVMIPYKLLPWIRMKGSSFMPYLLIPRLSLPLNFK